MGNYNSAQGFPSQANRGVTNDMNDVKCKSPRSSPGRNSPKTTVKDMINHVKSMPNNTINNALYGLLVNKTSILDNMEGKGSNSSSSSSDNSSINSSKAPSPPNDRGGMVNYTEQIKQEDNDTRGTDDQDTKNIMINHQTMNNTVGRKRRSEEGFIGEDSDPRLRQLSTESSDGQQQSQDSGNEANRQMKSDGTGGSGTNTPSKVAFNPKKRFIQRYGGPETGGLPASSTTPPPATPKASTNTTTTSNVKDASNVLAATGKTPMKPLSNEQHTMHEQKLTSTGLNGKVLDGKGRSENMVSMRTYLDEMMAQMVRTPLNELEMHRSSSPTPTATKPAATTHAKEVPVQKSTMTQYDLIQQKIREMLQDEDCGGSSGGPPKSVASLPLATVPPVTTTPSATENGPHPAVTPLTLISKQIEAVMRQQPLDDGRKPQPDAGANAAALISAATKGESSLDNAKDSSKHHLMFGYPQLRSHLGSITKGTPHTKGSRPQIDEVLLAEQRAPKDTVYSIITNEIKQRVYSKEKTAGDLPSEARRNSWSFPNRAAAADAGKEADRYRKMLGNSPHRPIVIDSTSGQNPHLLTPSGQATLERPASYHGNQSLEIKPSASPPGGHRRESFSKSLRDVYFGKKENNGNVGKFIPEAPSPNRLLNPPTPHDQMLHRAHTIPASSSVSTSNNPTRPTPSPHHQQQQHPHRYAPYPSPLTPEQQFSRPTSAESKPGFAKKVAYSAYTAGSREAHQGQGHLAPQDRLTSPRNVSHQPEAGRRSHSGLYEKQGYAHHPHGDESAQQNVVFQQGPSDARSHVPQVYTGSITAGTPRSAGPLLVEKQRELLSEAYEIQSHMSPPCHQAAAAARSQRQESIRQEYDKDRESHYPAHLHRPGPSSPYMHSPHSQSGGPYQVEPGHIPKTSISIGQAGPVTAPPPLMSLKDVVPDMVQEGGLSLQKPDGAYRARSRSPLARDRAGCEMEQNTRQTPRAGGDFPLDLSSKKEVEPARSTIPVPQLAPRSLSPPTVVVEIPHGGGEVTSMSRVAEVPRLVSRPTDKSIYQEEWLKSYILPPDAVDKLHLAQQTANQRKVLSESQKPQAHMIVSGSHDSVKASEPPRQPAGNLDLGLLPKPTADYLVATAQMAYRGGPNSAPYGFIYPMALGLKPGYSLGLADGPAYAAKQFVKDRHTGQPLIQVPADDQQKLASTSNNSSNSGRPEKVRNLGPNLLGDHPPDDVLSLTCVLCRADYGNIHRFIRHFHRDHSKEGEPQRHHVVIRSISQAKLDKLEVAERRAMNEMAVAKEISPAIKKEVMHCRYCSQEFPTNDWGLFRKHMRSHETHPEPHEEVELPQKLPLRCLDCRVEFGSPEEHRFHMSLCHSQRGCLCRVCSETFGSVDVMYRHIHTVHKGLSLVEIEYCCLDCGKTSDTEKELYVHWLSVHGETCSPSLPATATTPVPNVTLAVRTRVKDQGVSMSPPSGVHRVTPDTTYKDDNGGGTVRNDSDSSTIAKAGFLSRDGKEPEILSKYGGALKGVPLVPEKLPPSHPKAKALTYLEFLEQKVEEEHQKQAQSSSSNKSLEGGMLFGAGGDRLSRSPNLKRHVEEEVGKVHHGQQHHHHHHLSDAVATGKKIPRLAEGERAIALATEISERNKDLHLPGHPAEHITTVDSKMTEIITSRLAEKKQERGDGGSSLGDGRRGNDNASPALTKQEDKDMKNENLMMRAFMTSFLSSAVSSKESMDRILSALKEQDREKEEQPPLPAEIATGTPTPHKPPPHSSRSDITDSDIIDATVLAGISKSPAATKAASRSFGAGDSSGDRAATGEGSVQSDSCSQPPELENSVSGGDSSGDPSAANSQGGTVNRVAAVEHTDNSQGSDTEKEESSDIDEGENEGAETSMPVLEPERPTAPFSTSNSEERVDFRDVGSDIGSKEVGIDRRNSDGKASTANSREDALKLPKKRILERVDSLEEPPLVIDMGKEEDSTNSVRESSSEEEEIEAD